MTKDFDLEQAIKALQSGQDLTGKDGFLTPLIKQITEAALRAELEQHLEDDDQPNRKNGFTKKTVKSSVGAFELDTPRDRTGLFEPKLVKKNQTKLTDEIDRKILSMFSLGMSYRDIRGHVEDMYGVEDILIACVDGLTGFPEAIATIYPDTEVQQCVIHQIRNSLKCVASKHQKEFMADLKPVYRAVSKEAAEMELSKWGQQYPIVLRS